MSTNSDESTLQLARLALSEVTPATLDRCARQFRSIFFQNNTVIKQIAKLVVDLVLEKPTSSQLYAELCSQRIMKDYEGDMAFVSLFRDALATHAQSVFAETVSACKKKAQSGPNMGPDSDKMGKCGAICCFISHLYVRDKVPPHDMKKYLNDLILAESYNETLFGCAMQMIRAAGKKLTATSNGKVYVTKTLEQLEAASQNFSHESRSMLRDLEKLRQTGWVDDDELLKNEPSCSGCAKLLRYIEVEMAQLREENRTLKARLSKLEQPQQSTLQLARLALSEVTPATLDRCARQFRSIFFQNNTVIKQIAKLVVDLVLEKPTSSQLYAELCSQRIIKDYEGDMAFVSLFRDALATHAQSVFAEAVSACKKKAQSGPNMGPDSDKMGQCGAICCFISHLFNHRIVHSCEMKKYLDDLLIPEPYNEELFGCAIQMIRAAGKKLTATSNGKVYVTKTLEQLEAASQNFSHESRSMLRDLEKLRQTGWVVDDELLKNEPSCSGCAKLLRYIEVEMAQLREENRMLKAEMAQIKEENRTLREENRTLTARLSKLEQPQQNVAE